MHIEFRISIFIWFDTNFYKKNLPLGPMNYFDSLILCFDATEMQTGEQMDLSHDV